MRTPLPTPKGNTWGMVYFFELDLPSGMIRLTTATHDITVDGVTWVSIGRLGSISSITEGLELLITQVSVTLQAIPLALFPVLAAERYRNKRARLLIGIWEDGLVGNIIPLVLGKITESSIDPSPNMKITLKLSSDLSTIKYREASRYSNAEQRVLFPGDKGLEFVSNLKNLKLNWGVS